MGQGLLSWVVVQLQQAFFHLLYQLLRQLLHLVLVGERCVVEALREPQPQGHDLCKINGVSDGRGGA